MKILIVSDNHGDREILTTIAATFKTSVDIMVHCGDSEMAVNDPLFESMPSVLGNNDFGQPFAKQQLLEVGTQRLLVTHGHLQNVNFTMNNLAFLAQEQHADIVAYGHTHQLSAIYSQGTLYVNPGSISLPRGRYARLGGTFAIVDVQSTRFTVQYYNRSMNAIPELRLEFEREKK
ncbi:MAG: metallophosphoesterase [Lactobacillus sp.]|nr:MAG: metallophosphoesterase [Lactobacillus sp.]